MADYCTNSDLTDVRPKILSYGVSDWADQIAEATRVINRALETRWYRQACQEYEVDYREIQYDADLLLNATTQLTKLGVYKSLEIIYKYLMKDSPTDDGFKMQAEFFAKEYMQELSEVLAQGLDYDWDESGALYYTEKRMPQMRRLQRV